MMPEDFDPSLSSWLKRVMETRDDEIDCDECLDLVSQFVDLELKTRDAASHLPQLVHHLNQCPACSETYEVLRELAQLEEQGGLPTIQELIDHLESEI